MNNLILLFSILLLTMKIGFCQEEEIMIEFSNSEPIEQKTESGKFRTYFFRETLIDSSIFFQDSILLFNDRVDREDSRLELFNDSKFLLLYNIKLETVTKTDSNKGEMMQLTIQNSDEIVGKYGLLQATNTENDEFKDVSLRFILKDASTYDFDILNKNNHIILIKK